MRVLYPSSFPRLLTEFEAFSRSISSAKRYLELRKTAKASRFVTAIENSEELRGLLAARPESSTLNEFVTLSVYWTCLSGLYLAVLLTGCKLATGSAKLQV